MKFVFHILSCIPTLYSVRTTVLSKGWKNLWTFVPTLDFDYGDRSWTIFEKFADFVDGALKLHNPPTIRKFRLHIENIYKVQEKHFSRIRNWICAAMRHELSELDLYFNPTQNWRDNSYKLEFKLPRRVDRCKTLEVSKVHSNCITYPSTSPGVSRVEYLNLPGLKFETCSLPNFSNLKQLKLNLFGGSYVEYVMELLKRTPKLEDLVLNIDFSSWYDEEYEGYVPFEPPEIVPICVVSHLKTVSINQITGHDDQLDMVKYLLKFGEVPRNVTIVTCGLGRGLGRARQRARQGSAGARQGLGRGLGKGRSAGGLTGG
ncbi:hypothetical protein ACLB2K_050616 [Fragaria x ananassa]